MKRFFEGLLFLLVVGAFVLVKPVFAGCSGSFYCGESVNYCGSTQSTCNDPGGPCDVGGINYTCSITSGCRQTDTTPTICGEQTNSFACSVDMAVCTDCHVGSCTWTGGSSGGGCTTDAQCGDLSTLMCCPGTGTCQSNETSCGGGSGSLNCKNIATSGTLDNGDLAIGNAYNF